MIREALSTWLMYLLITLVLIAVLPATMQVNAASITVTLNKACYDLGEKVLLNVSATGLVAIEVYGPNDELVWIDELNVSGKAALSFTIPSNASEGTYYVYAALENQAPQVVATFLVRKPKFIIVNYTKSVTGYAGSTASISVNISNSGADGYVNVILINSEGVKVASNELLIPYNKSKLVTLSFTLPNVTTATNQTWIVEAYNVKYKTVDSSASISVHILVKKVTTTTTTTMTKTTTTTYVPPPPPPPTTTKMTTTKVTTTTRTRTTMTTITTMTRTTRTKTTTTTHVPPMVKVVNLTSYTAPNGSIIRSVKVSMPMGASLIIPKGCTALKEGKPVKVITVSLVKVPPPAPSTQVVAGPIYRLGPSGTKFSKPVTIVLPFNKSKIPAGYTPLPAYYNVTQLSWVPIKVVSINFTTGKVIAQVTHLTLFSVIAFKPSTITKVTTLTKTAVITMQSTTYKALISYTTLTGTITSKVSLLATLTVTKPVTITNYVLKKSVTTYTPPPSTVTVVKHVLTTKTLVSKIAYPQLSYVYGGFAALVAAIIFLIVINVGGGRRGG